jgi:uncharacterized protein
MIPRAPKVTTCSRSRLLRGPSWRLARWIWRGPGVMCSSIGVTTRTPRLSGDRPKTRRSPFCQFIVKLHSRCNLACDYCYVYNKADQRWRTRPRVMSTVVMDDTVRRVADHVRTHQMGDVEVILHGGEPLLAGAERIAYLVARLRAEAPARVHVVVQTNGTLLDRAFLQLFRDLDVLVGVSLDGDRVANDRHRVRSTGHGSYVEVTRALRELAAPEFRALYGGLLCTVDIANDPVRTYEALVEFSPPAIDFLFPHGNWTSPPPERVPGSSATPYGDWLVAVFERWYGAPRRETSVRIFEEIINVILGGSSRLEGIGLTPAAMIVVETDGTIERSDVLASVFEGAAATGLHVSSNSFDDVGELSGRFAGLAGRSRTCQMCELGTTCGGGLFAHRYSEENGFDNPSVYCADLYRLITTVRERLTRDLVPLRQGRR